MLAVFAGCAGGVDGDQEREAASVATGATYRLIRSVSNKCLDAFGAGTTNGTNIDQWTCSSSTAQQFRVDSVGGGAVRLVNPSSGKCVDVNGAGTSNGTKIQLWTCNTSGAQSWVPEDMGNGFTRLRNPHSGKCLDVNGAGTADGTKVQLWTCNTSSAQQWKFSSVSGGGGSGGSGGGGNGGSTGGTTIHNVYITWYGFNDNSCQVESQHDCNTIAFPKSAGFPVAHDIATEGLGTFDSPNTFATAATDSGSPAELAPGTRIYVPEVRKYFIMEDQCFECGQEWFTPTQGAPETNYHVDLWMGPSFGSANTPLMSCEDQLTLGDPYHGTGTIIVNPPPDLPVDTTPLFSNDTCTAHTY
jgi:hypothetical protein